MNLYELKGRWNQFRGRVKEEWGRLTDDGLATVRGRRERLVGRIQEVYGVARGKVERRLAALERLLEEDRPATPAPRRRSDSRLTRHKRNRGGVE